jgi:hypothetical protein
MTSGPFHKVLGGCGGMGVGLPWRRILKHILRPSPDVVKWDGALIPLGLAPMRGPFCPSPAICLNVKDLIVKCMKYLIMLGILNTRS